MKLFVLLFLLPLAFCLSSTTPSQIHIALAGVDSQGVSNGMAVSWSTVNATNTATVKYGLQSGQYTFVSQGYSVSYYQTFHHHVVLPNLKPSTTYYYIAGDEAGGFSSENHFVTAPATPETSFTAAIYGDMGLSNSESTFNQIQKLVDGIDIFWHVGDISYADDMILGNHYEDVWDKWTDKMSQIAAASKPYMVLPGNHEADCHTIFCAFKNLRNFTAFNNRFRMPFSESGSNSNMWYSFNYANVHFVSISSETDFPHSPEGQGSIWNYGGFGNQMAWLEADLAKAAQNRDKQPWIFVAGHRPVYCTRDIDAQGNPIHQTAQLQKAVEDMFHKYGVDVYFSGHVHAYEASYPVYQNKVEQKSFVNPTDPVYVITGAAGQVEGHNVLPVYSPDWLRSRNYEDYGLGLLKVHNNTHISWSFLRSEDGLVVDSFDLVKTRN